MHQAVIGLGDIFAGRKFIGLGWVDSDDIVDILCNDQRGGRRCRNGVTAVKLAGMKRLAAKSAVFEILMVMFRSLWKSI